MEHLIVTIFIAKNGKNTPVSLTDKRKLLYLQSDK